jgi:phenylalanyl-tRNA synthetase beta chain
MYISYSWLKELVDFNLSVEETDQVLTMLGIEVESKIDYGNKYKNFYIAKVLKKDKHPNADKLSVCIVDYKFGNKLVVCGAPNVDEGQKVVLGIPGAVVPNGGFAIEKREIRKIASDGMICSKAELEIGTDHSGIWVLPEDAQVGMTLAEYLKLDDVAFEIGVTPNRADCLSHFGISRELAAYRSLNFTKPAISLKEGDKPVENFASVEIIDSEKCPRYTGRVILNTKVCESPDWLKNKLTMLGMRPINVVVDVTNYVLIESGQPLHAFDLDKLARNKIIVRTAAEGEKFITLDSKERTLDDKMLMICDGDKPVAVGGVMGGENSEITDGTTNILIESAFFMPSSIRRTSKKLGIQSEASYRFERGVDIGNITYAADRAASLIAELAGGEIAKGIIDNYPNPVERAKCSVRYKRAEQMIGVNLTPDSIVDMLQRLQFEVVDKNEESVTVLVPTHRVDIFEEIDLIEEIARLYNYDNITPGFSTTINFEKIGVHEKLAVPQIRQDLRQFLIPKGFTEILTQNQTDPSKNRLTSTEWFELSNPLGEELSTMRTSLVPSMLATIKHNVRFGNKDLRLFEIGKVFKKVPDTEDTFIPGCLENEMLLIAMTGRKNKTGWDIPEKPVDFYDIKGLLKDISGSLRLDIVEQPFKNQPGFSKNSLSLIINGINIGCVGEITGDFLKVFEIDNPVYCLLLDLQVLKEISRPFPQYRKVSQFPKVVRDLAFILDDKIEAASIQNVIQESGGELLSEVLLFDMYKGKSIGENKKNLAFSLTFSSPDRTLRDEEIEKALNNIVVNVESKFSAILRKF